MATTFRTLLGFNHMGETAIGLLSGSLAPSTYANYDSALHHYFAFCAEEGLTPLHATPATMVHYTIWLGLLGTVAASSMQPYFPVVNKYFRDHKLPPVAVGDLLAHARRGLEMRQQRMVPLDTKLLLSAAVALDMLRAAYTLRFKMTWTPASLQFIKLSRTLTRGMRQLRFLLPRRDRHPLSHRRHDSRLTLSTDLSLCTQIHETNAATPVTSP
jgi:hypothetical protein